MNPVKEKLRQGEVVFGQLILELFTPGIGPMLANCGMDFVIYDMEHGLCDIRLLAEMITSCRGSDIVPVARIPDLNAAPLSRVLDLGARGVMLPRVETREQMEEAVGALKYAPRGKRGVALGIAHDLYHPGDSSFFEQANDDTLVIAIIETAKAFENLEEIISVPGLDIAWMGHYDLTVSWGIPAQFDHPRFLHAMDALVAACDRHGVAPGFLPATPEDALHWIRKGFRSISLGSDIGTYMSTVRSFHKTVLDGMRGLQGERREAKV